MSTRPGLPVGVRGGSEARGVGVEPPLGCVASLASGLLLSCTLCPMMRAAERLVCASPVS